MKDKVCLLITTFNRSAQLNRSLERLCNLTIPDEVLVVDDGSSDNCKETVENFKGRLPIRYIYNHNPEWSICSFARNIGIKNTECDIIITAEPEILFVTDVIAQMLEEHTLIPGKVISAGTVFHMGERAILHADMITNPSERLKAEHVNDSGHGTNPFNPAGYAKIKGWVAPFCALYRRKWLTDINGWDEDLPGAWGFDDTLLLTRLRHGGIGQQIDPSIEVVHQWHSKLPPDVQYKASVDNESMMKNRGFIEGSTSNDIIANKNIEWGVIKMK